jgi:hypothetical protein
MPIDNECKLYMLPLLMVCLLPFSMKKNMLLKQNSRNLNENLAVFRPRVPVKHWKITLMFWLAKLNTIIRVGSTKNAGNWHLRKSVAFIILFHFLFPYKCCPYIHMLQFLSQVTWKGPFPFKGHVSSFGSCNGAWSFQWSLSFGVQLSEGLSSKVSMDINNSLINLFILLISVTQYYWYSDFNFQQKMRVFLWKKDRYSNAVKNYYL